MSVRNTVLLVTLVALACACPGRPTADKRNARPATPQAPDISLVFTTELKGQLEPCGCTTDPLGDLARFAAYLARTRAEHPTAYLDGGSTLFSLAPVPEDMAFQEKAKAEVVATLLPELPAAATGLGPFDLAFGAGAVRPPRQAANVPADAGIPLEAPKVIELGGARVGVFGVVAPDALPGVTVTDPAAAAREAVAALKQQGAQLVVGLAHMDRRAARGLAENVPGIDVILVGRGAPEEAAGARPPEQAGTTWLVQPVNRGQTAIRLDLRLAPGGGPLTDAVGEARAQELVVKLADDIGELEKQIEHWKKQPDADSDFMTRKQKELSLLVEQKARLEREPLQVPAEGSWFTFEQVFIKKAMACDEQVQQRKQAYDRAVGEHNLASAKSEKPTPVPAGQAGYSGVEECGFCHEKAVKFWRETRHALAWETLEKAEKQFNRDCIGCHVTGWKKPGGATMAEHAALVDVQCESCHGPGSLHVDSDGKRLETLVKRPPKDLCFLSCHTPEHSDTFQYEAYLRTVTGSGHGEAFRKELGDGPTGRELRQAALAKAGGNVGDKCRK